MLINCNNKGCMQATNAALDLESMEVICAHCGKPVSVSEPMKRTLKSFGQVLRKEEKKAFMMACKNCNANREIVLSQENKTVCKVCHSEVKVHAAMKQAIIEIGRKISLSEKEDKEEE